MTPIFQYLLRVEDFKTAWLSLGVCILAVFWRKSAPLLKVVDFCGAHGVVIASASVAPLALGALFF